jgi:hypothetical protein
MCWLRRIKGLFYLGTRPDNRAIKATDETLALVLKKAQFREKHATTLLNERQQLMLNKLLDGFEGKLMKEAGEGRSTSYTISE